MPPAYLDAGLTSALAVPLSDRGRTIGALAVRSRDAAALRRRRGALPGIAGQPAGHQPAARAVSEEALNHAQRLESVGQLTGGIAHDFNNLLTVIQGNLQVLEELPALRAATRYGQQLVGAAARATRRGAELTGKLLAFSRRQVLQPTPVDVARAAALAGRHAAPHARPAHPHRGRRAAGLPAVLADPGQLESALLNIAINARDAMPEGGTLRFRAEPCSALPREVRSELDDPSAPDDGFVAISIADTGSGMPEEVKERAFEPFFTTKEAGRGTGLGLSTVYGFVKQSQGRGRDRQRAGRGHHGHAVHPARLGRATPAPTRTTPRAEQRAARACGADGRRRRRGAHRRAHLPRRAGLRGHDRAPTPSRRCSRSAPDADFDLLLTDIALGAGMRGTELAARGAAALPGAAVLLMSGFSAELLDADRDSPPSWELLRKPYTRAELARAIAKVARTRQSVTASGQRHCSVAAPAPGSAG